MPRHLPMNVHVDRSRHGQVRIYYWKRGLAKVRINSAPGTVEFENEVACARLGISFDKANSTGGQDKSAIKAGTFDWLILEHERRCINAVTVATMERRVRMLIECSNVKINDQRCGYFPYRTMVRAGVVTIRDTIRQTAGARNNVSKAIAALYSWAIDAGLAEINPAAKIKKLKSTNPDGYYTLNRSELATYFEAFPQGTKEHRLGLVLFFTGARCSDARLFGRQHLYSRTVATDDGDEQQVWLKYRAQKTRLSSGAEIDFPVLAPLLAEIEAMPANQMLFLINSYGRAFSPKGISNYAKRCLTKAGLGHASAHSFRKGGASISAEHGATHKLMMQIYGWSNAKQADTYIRKADASRIAQGAGRVLRLGKL